MHKQQKQNSVEGSAQENSECNHSERQAEYCNKTTKDITDSVGVEDRRESVNDGVGVNFVEPEEPMGDATMLNEKKCKKGLDQNDEKSDEYAQCRANAVEVTKNKLDCCEIKKKPKEIPVVSEHNAGAGEQQ